MEEQLGKGAEGVQGRREVQDGRGEQRYGVWSLEYGRVDDNTNDAPLVY